MTVDSYGTSLVATSFVRMIVSSIPHTVHCSTGLVNFFLSPDHLKIAEGLRGSLSEL